MSAMRMLTQAVLLVALSLVPVVVPRSAEPFPGNPIRERGLIQYSVPVGNEGLKATILCPEKAADGRPWVIAVELCRVDGGATSHIGQTQLDLIKRGFHIAALGPADGMLGAPAQIDMWNRLYADMTGKYGFSPKPALMGLSRQGLAIARWAAANSGKVACLYMDKAVCDFKSWPGGKLGIGKGSSTEWDNVLKYYQFKNEAEALAFKGNPVDLAAQLAGDKVPIIYVAGKKDEIVPYEENGARIEAEYKKRGGIFNLIALDEGHQPHGLKDPTPVVDLIVRYTSSAVNTQGKGGAPATP